MSFAVDRCTSAWAHIALCADLTWTTEPPDDFILANQRLWAQHCRDGQTSQSPSDSQNLSTNIQSDPEKSNSLNQNPECSSSSVSRLSVKDIIPESRLAQYGNYFYDDNRERCYTNINDKSFTRGRNDLRYENSDVTECWMLPEVEYWYHKFLDGPLDGPFPRRQRLYRLPMTEDFGRWVPSRVLTTKETADEVALAAKLQAVRQLWQPRTRSPSPPTSTRKMRARRRQPRRLAHIGTTPLNYHINSPIPLTLDPRCKFELPRLPQRKDNIRIIDRLPANVQAVVRASMAKSLPYRGTNVSRYAPTTQRPARGPERRNGASWSRDHSANNSDAKVRLPQYYTPTETKKTPPTADTNQEDAEETPQAEIIEQPPENLEEPLLEPADSPRKDKIVDDQEASTSAAAQDTGAAKKRLYSTVLSMSAPHAAINIAQVRCLRLGQKITPGLLKLNPKVVIKSGGARPNSDHKFEELEKEALEQYKASDESIDTKLRELEKQAVEQYSTSNSNTSCSSGQCDGKRTPSSISTADNGATEKKPTKFTKKDAVDSVVVYSQNFPDLKEGRAKTKSGTDLKNLHNPPRGEKTGQARRPYKVRGVKVESQRAGSDTDFDKKDNAVGNRKGSTTRWTLLIRPPKKRHLSMCASDLSSDEELVDAVNKHANPRSKKHIATKMKMAARGGGDLQPIMRKTKQ